MKKSTKVSVKTKPAPAPVDSPELRRWCIEQATKWPTHGGYGGGAGLPGTYMQPIEADVIGRAERLRKWVLSVS